MSSTRSGKFQPVGRYARHRLTAFVAAGAITAILSQTQPLSAHAAVRQEGGNRPVIFVHGWSGKPATFDDMKKNFRSAGYADGELFAWGYDSTRKGNEEIAAELRKVVEEKAKNSPDGKVDLVSHSMGGLSTLWYLRKMGGSSLVAHWAGIASPIHGTALAVQGAEMAEGSSFVKRLNEGEEDPAKSTPGPTRYATFRSNVGEGRTNELPGYYCDGIVGGVPSNFPVRAGKTSAVNGATNVVTPCLGHNEIHRDPWVVNKVIDFLGSPNRGMTPRRGNTYCSDGYDYEGRDGLVESRVQHCLETDGNGKIRAVTRVRNCAYKWGGVWYVSKSNYKCLPEQSHAIKYQGVVLSTGNAAGGTVERAGEFHGEWVRLPGSGNYSVSVKYSQKGPYWGVGPVWSSEFSLNIPE
ncbi:MULTISPECIES: lipase family alpha/beta hydrolase [unclassified Streptomyces]|uniref:lipase family alpha/beta hydrolase n=1 Tax=unclassified Streptomyces TaxID=2593676 RepID=UPI00381D5BC4